MSVGSGRTAQKERTRRAILDGARLLMQEGKSVTVAAAAEKHGISKATAYRYYSDAAVLAAEAGLDIAVDPYEKVVAGAADLRAKLKAISLYFFELALNHEAELRQFVGMSLTASVTDDTPASSRRAGRRIAMYKKALAEDDEIIGKDRQARLIRALGATTGAEAMIALLDVVGVDADSARETVEEVTDAVLDSYF